MYIPCTILTKLLINKYLFCLSTLLLPVFKGTDCLKCYGYHRETLNLKKNTRFNHALTDQIFETEIYTIKLSMVVLWIDLTLY